MENNRSDNESERLFSRRQFLKTLGLSSLTVAGLSACNGGSGEQSASYSESDIPTDQMTYRLNPKTGDKISILGFGMMRLPMLPSVSEEKKEEEIDQEMVNKLVDYAIAHGVNYFDTSPAYCQGKSERATGIALSRHPRDKYFIATKLSNFAPSTWNRESSIAMYRNSFKELQVDYIDYLLLHAVGIGNGMKDYEARYVDNGLLDFLLKEREEGRIKNLGFSYHGDIKVFDYLLSKHDIYKWDFVQIQLNYLDWKHSNLMNPRNTNSDYLYNELNKRGIPAVIMEPMLGGRLAKVPDYIVSMLKQREPEKSVASWAFRFAGSKPDVLTVLSGMNRMDHLQDNLFNYSPLVPLSNEEFDFLHKVATRMVAAKTIPCNDCKYCMPCPYGLDIPAILVHYNKCINDGNIVLSSQDSNYAEARRAFLVGYDRSVPKLRQADHCIGCNQCVSHCPQQINIPEEMCRIDEYVEKLKQEAI